MTRRRVKWWARLSASPQKLIKTAEGKAAVEVLTGWWIEAEGIYQPEQIRLDDKGRHPKPPSGRYTLPKFYQRLEQVPVPPLKDSDEVALDQIFEAFYSRTRSRTARKVAEGSVDQVRDAITRSAAARPELEIDPNVLNSIGPAIDGVIHASVHHAVHDSVHAAVHSAVHDAGAGGHSGGHGGGGGHH